MACSENWLTPAVRWMPYRQTGPPPIAELTPEQVEPQAGLQNPQICPTKQRNVIMDSISLHEAVRNMQLRPMGWSPKRLDLLHKTKK